MQAITLRELKIYKESLKLDSLQRNFVIGSLLGDGNLRFVGKNREASLIIDHGFNQKDYVLWKYQLLKNWVLTEPKSVNRIYHKDKERILTSFRFSTISHPEFTYWHNVFYNQGVKIIPKNIKDILVSPFSLAIWFMDDGNKNQQAVFLNTQQFSLEEQKVLQECLLKNFGLETTINKHWVYKGKQLYRIRVSTDSTKKMYLLVKDFLIPSMRYKFPLYPRNDFSD